MDSAGSRRFANDQKLTRPSVEVVTNPDCVNKRVEIVSRVSETAVNAKPDHVFQTENLPRLL
jgi:hypothetical protein